MLQNDKPIYLFDLESHVVERPKRRISRRINIVFHLVENLGLFFPMVKLKKSWCGLYKSNVLNESLIKSMFQLDLAVPASQDILSGHHIGTCICFFTELTVLVKLSKLE